MKAGVAKLNEMKERVVEELAWQMGRPTRYGGEFGGVNDRTNYMAEIAADTLAPMVVENSNLFERRIEREPHRRRLHRGAVELSLSDHDQHARPGADRRQHGDPEARDARRLLVGERLAEAFHAAGVPEDVFQNVVLDHDVTEDLIGQRAFGFVNFTGSVGGGAAMETAPRRAPSPRWAGAWRQGSRLCHGRRRS